MDDDQLILVDEEDKVLGHESKARCHDGAGIRHRAFSVFLFNPKGQVLIHKRAKGKRLWGDYWSNSCCSHPRRGEVIAEAAVRRVKEELGVDAEPQELYKFEYQAHFGEAGSEWELCSVLIGACSESIAPDPEEVADHEWLSPENVDAMIEEQSRLLTPWFMQEWVTLRRDYQNDLAPFLKEDLSS